MTSVDCRGAFNLSGPQECAVMRWGLRPLSFYVTPLCAVVSTHPTTWTWIRLGLTVLSWPLLLVAPRVASVCLLLNYLLDCVDGNLARMTHRASYWGKLLDGWVDTIGIVVPPFLLGVAVWLETGADWALLVGAGSSLLMACADVTRSRSSFVREWQTNVLRGVGCQPAAQATVWPWAARGSAWVAAAVSNLTLSWPALLWLPQGTWWSGWVVWIGYSALALVWVPFILRDIYPRIQYYRTSQHGHRSSSLEL